jgi:hypothetical protein
MNNHTIIQTKQKAILKLPFQDGRNFTHYYPAYTNLTAVPYAMISAALCMTEDDEYLTPTTASAPSASASLIILSVASPLALDIISL